MTPVVRNFSDLSPVEGSLINPATESELDEAQSHWPPILRAVIAESIAQGASPSIKIWQGKWGSKVTTLGQKGTSIQAIKVKNRVEGLIKLLVEDQESRLASGSELVYVDLVESAPWNVGRYMKVIGRDPLYKDIGLELIRIAIRESVKRGFEGRVGLHSIRPAEGFYRGLAMKEFGPDTAKGNMNYFEFEGITAKHLYGERA